jgi:hypothetical protein
VFFFPEHTEMQNFADRRARNKQKPNDTQRRRWIMSSAGQTKAKLAADPGENRVRLPPAEINHALKSCAPRPRHYSRKALRRRFFYTQRDICKSSIFLLTSFFEHNLS